MKTNAEGIALIKSFEKCVLHAYPDPGSELARKLATLHLTPEHYEAYKGWEKLNGVPWTIGWGHAENVIPGMVWTQEKADESFAKKIAEIETVVLYHLRMVPALTSNEFSAFVSLCYNMGTAHFGDIVSYHHLRAQPEPGTYLLDHESIAKIMCYIIHGRDGRVLTGLMRRRAAEIDLMRRFV